MKNRAWVIIGATSIIAREFAHLAAKTGHSLILVGRDERQLAVLAADLRLRHQVDCRFLIVNLAESIDELTTTLQTNACELDLFLGHTLMINNDQLHPEAITNLLQINVTSTIQILHAYLQQPQKQHHVLYLSSVAAQRGRGKNSLYGASKAAVEIYLQGQQELATQTQCITVATLGFIDTKSTYGEPGIFYAASPKQCAQACWKALSQRKQHLIYPFFWRFIMGLIRRFPFLGRGR